LAPGNEADNEGAQAKPLVHMKGEHGHCDTNDKVGYEDHRDDRQQHCDRVAQGRLHTLRGFLVRRAQGPGERLPEPTAA
jgi:hypothetical protein